MIQRVRKLVGTIVLVVFLALYTLVAMTVGALHVNEAPVVAQTLFYLVAGLAWVIPAGLLIRWMQKP